MFRCIADFESTWKVEYEATLRLFQTLTDASLEQRVTPTGRSLGMLAWHVTTSLGEVLKHTGLAVDGPLDHDHPPKHANAITERYANTAAPLARVIAAAWTDAHLLDEVTLFGQTWKLGAVLAMLVAHQTHHRGQMTVLMRQAGLPVPGVCGPGLEEWASMGLTART